LILNLLLLSKLNKNVHVPLLPQEVSHKATPEKILSL
jgi:hypothetical protein